MSNTSIMCFHWEKSKSHTFIFKILTQNFLLLKMLYNKLMITLERREGGKGEGKRETERETERELIRLNREMPCFVSKVTRCPVHTRHLELSILSYKLECLKSPVCFFPILKKKKSSS